MDKTIANNSKIKSSGSLVDWITKYDSLVIFGGFGVVIIITIILIIVVLVEYYTIYMN